MTRRFRKMCEIYKKFAKSYDCDFSDLAMKEMFDFESKGIGNISIDGFNVTGTKPNGFAVGKKWLNVTVSMWKEDLNTRGLISTVFKELTLPELVKNYPSWWLKSIGIYGI